MKKIIILLGPPGSGKGTQAKIIATNHSYGHISTGDLLRALSTRHDLDADETKALREMSFGRLVPDWLIYKLAFAAADQYLNNNQGVVFDGAIRNISQAQVYQEYFFGKNLATEVLALEVSLPDAQSFLRLTERKICRNCGAIFALASAPGGLCANCGGALISRADDNIDVVKKRIQEQGNAALEPLREFYKNQNAYSAVDGRATVDDVSRQIETVLAAT
ncbi:MAG: nucleoside monophosphate kinase [Candidatus Magasanikbacteria bacterium]|nr:nucleoside monophosphate kinase [Candidatus Magasanikbacteria bacterium]